MGIPNRQPLPAPSSESPEERARLRLQSWREQCGLSQTAIAAAVGWHQTAYSRFERGEAGASLDRLEAMARFFGRSLTDLLAPDIREIQPRDSFAALYHALPGEARRYVLDLMRWLARSTAHSG